MLIFDVSKVGEACYVLEKLIEQGQEHNVACLAVIICNSHT